MKDTGERLADFCEECDYTCLLNTCDKLKGFERLLREGGDGVELTSVEINGVDYEAPHEVLLLLKMVSVERDELKAAEQVRVSTKH